MNVSNHAKKRMKERCGANKKSIDRMAQNAFDRGLTHKDLSGKLCKYVDGLYLKYHTGNQIRLYGNNAYIFHDNVLITVLTIPSSLMKSVSETFARKKLKEDSMACNCGGKCKCRLHVGDIVQHFKHEFVEKGSNQYLYKILHIAYDQNEIKQVVYQALYGPDYRVWIRNYDEFMSEVDKSVWPKVKQKYVFELVKSTY